MGSGIGLDIREVLLVGHLRLVRPDSGDGDAGKAHVEAVSGGEARTETGVRGSFIAARGSPDSDRM